MSERYTRLYTLTTDLYAEGSPVIIMAGALLKDTQTNSVLTQLKIRNITDKKIKAAKISITPFDTAGNRLGDNVEFEYLDIAVWKNGDFGEKIPVRLPDNRARSFSVVVEQVVFEDNSIWTWDGNDWAQVVRPKHLTEKLTSKELIQQYKMEYGNSSQYIVTEDRDIWICTCGNYCKKSSFACDQCGNKFDELKNIDYEKLAERCQQRLEENKRRLEEEKKERAIQEEELRKKKEITNKKIKKTASVVSSIVIIILVPIIVLNTVIIPMKKYSKAESLVQSKQYYEAVKIYDELNDYKDSKLKKIMYWGAITKRESLKATYSASIGLKNDGTVVATGENDYGQLNIGAWTDIIAVSAGSEHTVGLKKDGTVVAVGNNLDGQCNVSNWKDIVAISTSYDHTVGLKSDGTVVATGDYDCGKCNVGDWTDIVSISAGASHTVGLKSDGTVIATKYTSDYYDGQCDVEDWSNIKGIFANQLYTVGIKNDGTVIITDAWESRFPELKNWTDITSISVYNCHIVGLKKDGTVVVTGCVNNHNMDVSNWDDIVAISTDYNHTIGLKKDGTVVVTGRNEYGQCNVLNWRDIGILK